MQKKIFFIACFFVYINCVAQHYPFVHYTPKDGLVNSRVRKAFQDSKGRMYFMTYGGLSIYDGARFTNYTAQNGLATDMVNDILEMDDDSMWIACNIKALNYLSHGKIQTFKPADGFCPTINQFIKSREGLVYVVADEGLFVFRQNRFIHLPFTNSHGLDAGKFLISVLEWKDWLLIVSDNSLNSIVTDNFYAFNKKTGKLTDEYKNSFISGACKAGNNQVYIIDNKGVLQLLDTTSLLHDKIHLLPPSVPYKDVSPGIYNMYFDRKKNLWLYYGIKKKIIRIDTAGVIKEFANGLSSDNSNNIFMDKEGSVWIAMNGEGIDKLVNDNIEIYDKYKGESVTALYTDESTDTAYLFCLAGKKILAVHNEKSTEYATGKIAVNTLKVSAGRIFLSDSKSVYTIEQTKQQPTLLYRDTLEASFGNIFIDPYHNLVLCGSAHITVLTGGLPVCHYPINYYIDQIGFDNKNRLWAASRGGDLFVLKIDPGKGRKYLELLKNYGPPYSGLSARSLTLDHFNNLWIGTRYEGLYRFEFTDDLSIRSFQRYTIKEGMSDNFITHLTCDNENNIWASTPSGVDKISFVNDKKMRIENITRSNYIYEQIGKTLINKQGVAWSYTADGKLIKISKSSSYPSFRPCLFITELKMGNTVKDNLSGPATFSYKQNSFSISAAAPSFYAEQQVKYSYLLQGSGNDQWSEPSNNSTFNFINLNPGAYTLKIKAIFPGARYPDQTIEYAFLIHPPWWRTLLVRLIAACLVLGLLIIGVRFYYQRKLEKQRISLEKQQAVEKERTRIATDIHDDLGSGLSRIRYLGEMVKLKTSQQQNILPDIEKISVFSDEMVDKMNEIVWALNEKNDSLEAIISYTRSFAVEYLSNNDIECGVNLPDEIPYYVIKGETRRNIFLSVKECLHNIVKHAGATQTNIAISVNHRLVVCIHDNGKGIDWKTLRPFSNGIINIKKRMKDAGGSVDFKNDNGTTVTLSIPL